MTTLDSTLHLADGPVPIPPGERGLRTLIAHSPIAVPDARQDLEGPAWEADGSLVFADVQGERVLRLHEDGRIATVARLDGLQPGGMAIADDGRILIAAGDGKGGGAIVAIAPDGSALERIVPESAGFFPNDLVFAPDGGFDFTDFRGTSTDPAGGVYHVEAAMRRVTPILPRLSMANGIALSPDGKTLWATEYGQNRLHRLKLAGPLTPQPQGSAVAYHFVGPAPDSMRADADGNLYVALYGQGRVLAFTKAGLPLGQILLPGREAGRNLSLTSMAIRPGSRELVIVTSDAENGGGASLFRAEAFGMALTPFFGTLSIRLKGDEPCPPLSSPAPRAASVARLPKRIWNAAGRSSPPCAMPPPWWASARTR